MVENMFGATLDRTIREVPPPPPTEAVIEAKASMQE